MKKEEKRELLKPILSGLETILELSLNNRPADIGYIKLTVRAMIKDIVDEII